MKGKAIILAGGSGGLGAATAEAIASQGGIPVIGCLKNRERADTLASYLGEKYGLQVPVVVGDISSPETRRRLIEQARVAGDLYGLVPFVGDAARIPIENASEDDLLNSLRINFVSPLLLARDFATALAEADGSIVFIGTMQGVAVFPGSAAYAAPKAALIHGARILAKQWKIRVNVVCPGVNNAGMAEQSVQSGKYDSFISRQIIPRWGTPQDVARAVLFFLQSDNYVTGQVLTIDGGLTAKM